MKRRHSEVQPFATPDDLQEGTLERKTAIPEDPVERMPSKRTVVAASLFVIVLGAYVVSRFVPSIPASINEFFLALTAAMAVHLLDRLWLFRDTTEMMEELKTQIVHNVAAETSKLIDQLDIHTKRALKGISGSIQKSIRSLDAMSSSGLLRVYADRAEAAADIRDDLVSTANHKIRIIGISLNDFVLRRNKILGDAWHSLRERISNSTNESHQLDVKILLIDPSCFGAQLRSKGEQRHSSGNAGRLKQDMDVVIEELLDLQRTCRQLGIKFECKLYRLPPILFLCYTDMASYVQQYYFWSSRMDNKSFPVFKFQNVHSDGASLHLELEQHFNWIWDKASIGLADYHDQWSLGADKGISQAGIVNVYTDPDEALMRMRSLLLKAKAKVSIQGISLHSFLNRYANVSLYQALSELTKRTEVDIDILFLDENSDQAKFRAYREYSFDHPSVSRAQYFAGGDQAHQASTLFRETKAAQAALETMVREIAERKEAGWKPKLRAGCYDSAPYCFLLRVDDTVLVEQYHYGKLPDDRSGARVVLGKDLPLAEYIRDPSDLFEQTKKTPFALLLNHFEFALAEAKPLAVEDWAAKTKSAKAGDTV